MADVGNHLIPDFCHLAARDSIGNPGEGHLSLLQADCFSQEEQKTGHEGAICATPGVLHLLLFFHLTY